VTAYSKETKAQAELLLREREKARRRDAPLSLYDFARENLKIQVVDEEGEQHLIPLVLNVPQRTFIENTTGRDLILKARQLGFSTVVQADLYRAQTTKGATTLTICHDADLTTRLRKMAETFYQNDPRPFVTREYANATQTTFPYFGSEATIVSVGGKATAGKKGRGSTTTHIHGSEVAFWPDAESVIAGALQAGNPKVTLESTPNGAQGYFFELCMEAREGRGNWKLHFFPWFTDPRYVREIPLDWEPLTAEEEELAILYGLSINQIAWRREKQRELKTFFIQEYPEDPITCFLLSGLGYFGDLSHVFIAERIVEPIQGHRYAAGLDFGQTKDYTVLSVLDVETLRQVDLLRINRLPWKEMRRQALEMCRKWGVTILWAEGNSMGTTNIEELWEQQVEMGLNELAINVFWTQGDRPNVTGSKTSIMSSLHESFHKPNGVRLLPISEQKVEFQSFEAVQNKTGTWSLGAPNTPGAHDDCVIATALALHGCIFGASGGIHIPE
jgi:hypothetical protein